MLGYEKVTYEMSGSLELEGYHVNIKHRHSQESSLVTAPYVAVQDMN